MSTAVLFLLPGLCAQLFPVNHSPAVTLLINPPCISSSPVFLVFVSLLLSLAQGFPVLLPLHFAICSFGIFRFGALQSPRFVYQRHPWLVVSLLSVFGPLESPVVIGLNPFVVKH